MSYNKNIPLISVIIPVYNREKYLKKCLDIITNQSYKNIEIIVVNDGSTDNSMNIAKEYKSIRIINFSKNKGQSVARNTGIDNVNGKYLHFMDDDDIVNNKFYENLLKASEEVNADMSCCSFINEKLINKSQIFNRKNVYFSTNDKYTITNVAENGYCVRYFFKTSFVKENNLRFENGRLIEYLPFSFKAVFYANKIITVPNSLYTYIYNTDSSLNNNDFEKQKKQKKIINIL